MLCYYKFIRQPNDYKLYHEYGNIEERIPYVGRKE